MKDISLVAVFAAILLTSSVIVSALAAGTQNWFLMAGAGVQALAGIGFVALSWRD